MSVFDMFSLAGKTALVTGASRGIGRAIASGLAEAGADVAVLARSTEALEILFDEITTLGRKCMAITCDVTEMEEVERAVSSVIAEFGAIDIAVNNAGGTSHFSPFLEMELEDWQYTIDLNLKSILYFCRAAGRHMVSRSTGTIINVASAAALGGFPMLSHYSATKAAAVSLTRSLGTEWACAGVRVNSLLPGWIDTTLTKAIVQNPAVGEGLLHAVPARRWGDPQDVVGPVLFLASDAARFVTGATLIADGGLTAYVGGPATLDLMPLGRVPA